MQNVALTHETSLSTDHLAPFGLRPTTGGANGVSPVATSCAGNLELPKCSPTATQVGMSDCCGTHETLRGKVAIPALPKVLAPHVPLNEDSSNPSTDVPPAKKPTATQALVIDGLSGCVVQESPLSTSSSTRRPGPDAPGRRPGNARPDGAAAGCAARAACTWPDAAATPLGPAPVAPADPAVMSNTAQAGTGIIATNWRIRMATPPFRNGRLAIPE